MYNTEAVFNRYTLLILCVLLTSCSSMKDEEILSTPKIIYTDETDLKASLEEARRISLETGEQVTIRMPPRENPDLLKRDQEYAKKTIVNSYGKEFLLP